MERPNLFKYATKELSQDAMICWLLKCCHAENPKYREIGIRFVKFILQYDSIDSQDIELEEHSPYKQYYHMDVYTNIRVKNEIIPVIFEDKTDTFLHDKQDIRYCEQVQSWKSDKKWTKGLFPSYEELEWGTTVYVVFKTGYIFGWQEARLEKIGKAILQNDAILRLITLEDMLSFLDSVHEDALLSDYKMFLKEKKAEQEDCNEKMCDRYFQKIFGDKTYFLYSYQGWSSKDFVAVYDTSRKKENCIMYGIRIQRLKNQYAVIIYQYRRENALSGSTEKKKNLKNERYTLTEKTRELCEEIFREIGGIYPVLEHNDEKRMPNKNCIFYLFINEENEADVCGFFRRFIDRFQQLAGEKLGGEVLK